MFSFSVLILLAAVLICELLYFKVVIIHFPFYYYIHKYDIIKKNNKQDFLNGKYNKVNCRLFTCTANDNIVVIPTEQGSIAIGMQIVRDIVSKEL